MVQQLGAFVALTEDPSSVVSTHLETHNHLSATTLVSVELMPAVLPTLQWLCFKLLGAWY